MASVYELRSRSSGLRLFAQGGHGLVMSDFTMPGANGLQLIESVRDRNPSLGCIMLAASAVDPERQRLRLGFKRVRMPADLARL